MRKEERRKKIDLAVDMEGTERVQTHMGDGDIRDENVCLEWESKRR